jgi:hypothetical protein
MKFSLFHIFPRDVSPPDKLSALNGVKSGEKPYIIFCAGRRADRDNRANAGRAWSVDQKDNNRLADSMFRIFKALVTFVLFAFLGLVAYAYLGDLSPERNEVSQPVELDVGQ